MPTFVSDTFTSPDGTLLENRTGEIGASWSKHPSWSGTMTVQGGKLSPGSGSGLYLASGLPSGTNQVVEADYTFGPEGGGGAMRLVVRSSAAELTYYFVEIYRINGTLAMGKSVAGVGSTTLGTFPGAFSFGQTKKIRFEVLDNLKRVLVDGVERITSGDNEITAPGRIGVYGYQSVTGAFALDNLQATDVIGVSNAFDTRATVNRSAGGFFDTRLDLQRTLALGFDSWLEAVLGVVSQFDTSVAVDYSRQMAEAFDTRAAVSALFSRAFDTRVDLLTRALRFFHPQGEVLFSRAPLRPDRAVELIQAEERSAGGVRFGFDPYLIDRRLPLRWRGLSRAEADALEIFVRTVAKGMAEPFAYVDAAGVIRTVRLAAPQIRRRERAGGRFDVEIDLLEL